MSEYVVPPLCCIKTVLSVFLICEFSFGFFMVRLLRQLNQVSSWVVMATDVAVQTTGLFYCHGNKFTQDA